MLLLIMSNNEKSTYLVTGFINCVRVTNSQRVNVSHVGCLLGLDVGWFYLIEWILVFA